MLYKTTAHEVHALEQALSEENRTLGWFYLFLGALVGTGVSYLSASPLDEVRRFSFKLTLAALLIGVLWFGMAWRHRSRWKGALLDVIRCRVVLQSTTPPREQGR